MLVGTGLFSSGQDTSGPGRINPGRSEEGLVDNIVDMFTAFEVSFICVSLVHSINSPNLLHCMSLIA